MSAEQSDAMRTGFSMALDAIPFVGTVKGIQEVLTGVDLITGQQLSVADRVAEGAGVLLSVLPEGKLWGTLAAKEAIEGGAWVWKQVGKEAVKEVGSLDFIDETGRLGGKLYSEKDLKMLGNYLQKRGVTLKVGDEFLPPLKGGGFNYNTDELILKSNPTQYEVWHELSHYIQYKQIGKEAYSKLSRTNGPVPMNDLTVFNAPEQFVYDMLSNSPKKWESLNEAEQLHANWYITQYGGIR